MGQPAPEVNEPLDWDEGVEHELAALVCEVERFEWDRIVGLGNAEELAKHYYGYKADVVTVPAKATRPMDAVLRGLVRRARSSCWPSATIGPMTARGRRVETGAWTWTQPMAAQAVVVSEVETRSKRPALVVRPFRRRRKWRSVSRVTHTTPTGSMLRRSRPYTYVFKSPRAFCALVLTRWRALVPEL